MGMDLFLAAVSFFLCPFTQHYRIGGAPKAEFRFRPKKPRTCGDLTSFGVRNNRKVRYCVG